MKRIFISIASFRDVQLKYTIKSIITNAKHPERLVFGICNQDTQDKLDDLKRWIADSKYNQDQFRVHDVLDTNSDGCCWARTIVQQLLKDEELYMQIDAHMRFVPEWDVLCETMLEACQKKSAKAIVSSYVTICEMDEEKIKITHGDSPFRMRCDMMYNFSKVRYIPESVPNWKTLTEPQPWHTISAHFIFTTSDWVRDVPYDPELYFDGEEDTLGLRSWTRGWDIYYPHTVVCYHYYIRKGHKKHFDSVKTWGAKDQAAKQRLENIWIGKVAGVYGLGNVRSLEDYRFKYGVDYINRDVYAPGTKLENIPKNKMVKLQTDNKMFSLQITYDNAIISKIADGKWKESAIDGNTYNFDEVEETNDEWLLIDKGRSLHMKLKKNGECWIKFGSVDWYIFRKNGKITRNGANINAPKPANASNMVNTTDANPHALPITNRIPFITRKVQCNCHHNKGGTEADAKHDHTKHVNKKIALITLGTPNMEAMLEHSRRNHEYYCLKHDYDYIYYTDTLVPFEKVTWNKVYVLEKHLKKYEWLVWIDSDAIITNMDILLEDIIKLGGEENSALFCDDIGGWKLNSGVMFWKNDAWSADTIKKWLQMEKLPHSKGAEQQQLINLLPTLEEPRYKIFPRRLFNQHPKEHQEDDFILHMMGKSGEERINTFTKFNEKLLK